MPNVNGRFQVSEQMSRDLFSLDWMSHRFLTWNMDELWLLLIPQIHQIVERSAHNVNNLGRCKSILIWHKSPFGDWRDLPANLWCISWGWSTALIWLEKEVEKSLGLSLFKLDLTHSEGRHFSLVHEAHC